METFCFNVVLHIVGSVSSAVKGLHFYTMVFGSLKYNIVMMSIAKRKYSDINKAEGDIFSEDRNRLSKIVVEILSGRVGSVLGVTSDNIVILSFLGNRNFIVNQGNIC